MSSPTEAAPRVRSTARQAPPREAPVRRTEVEDDEYEEEGAGVGVANEEAEVMDLTPVPTSTVLAKGVYPAEVKKCEGGRSQAGNRKLAWQITVFWTDKNGNDRTALAFAHTGIEPEDQLPRLKRWIQRVTPEYDISAFNYLTYGEFAVGRQCQVKLGQDSYRGELKNTIEDILPPTPAQLNGNDEDEDEAADGMFDD